MKRISKRKALDLINLYPGDQWTVRKSRVEPGCGQGTVSGSSEHHEEYRYAGVPIVLVTVECGSGKARAYAYTQKERCGRLGRNELCATGACSGIVSRQRRCDL